MYIFPLSYISTHFLIDNSLIQKMNDFKIHDATFFCNNGSGQNKWRLRMNICREQGITNWN